MNTTYNAFCDESTRQRTSNQDIHDLKTAFGIINVFVCSIGIAGNVLNLITLRSASLQTVPFRYIRALAVYDLIGLTAILFHYFLKYTGALKYQILGVYAVYVEDLLINSFFVAGLYCAVLLTVERYLLLRNPHKKRIFNTSSIMFKLIIILVISIILYMPMVLQVVPKRLTNGIYVRGNNQGLLCGEGKEFWFNVYTIYGFTRESLRFLNVLLLVYLNYAITRKLQTAKRNRRQLIKRPSSAENPDAIGKNDKTTLMRSFTEKRLTALMIWICVVYVIGNVPQTIVMVFQNESSETNFSFQVFRHISNTCEVLNHCLNFFMFCMASSEYSRAFLSVCPCMKVLPCFSKLVLSRRFTLSEYASESKTAFSRKNSFGARRSSIANRKQGYARRNTAAIILHNGSAASTSTTVTAVTPVDIVATVNQTERSERRRSTRRRSTPTVGFHGIRMSLSDENDDGCLVIENAIFEDSRLLAQTKVKSATDFRDGDDFL